VEKAEKVILSVAFQGSVRTKSAFYSDNEQPITPVFSVRLGFPSVLFQPNTGVALTVDQDATLYLISV
jgi:hypothetical protein